MLGKLAARLFRRMRRFRWGGLAGIRWLNRILFCLCGGMVDPR